MDDLYTLAHSSPSKKDFLDTTDFEQSEILDIVKTAVATRAFLKSGGVLDTLYHKNLAMLFEQKSTRTRISFEVAMSQLGGHALNLAPGAIQLGDHETIEDTAQVFGRMCDLVMARVDRHESVKALAKFAKVPVINGMSDYNHPTQEIGDIITILDNLPEDKNWNDVKVVFVGDSTQVCASLMMITTKLGMNFVHYGPDHKLLSEDFQKIGRENCEKYGGSITVTSDRSCLKGADFVYTDVWYGLYDKETPKEVYMKDFYPTFQVNDDLMAATENENVKFMHCLPANRNEEVTDSVMDGKSSICFDQAENRLTAQRGLVLYFGGVAQATLDIIKSQKEGKH